MSRNSCRALTWMETLVTIVIVVFLIAFIARQRAGPMATSNQLYVETGSGTKVVLKVDDYFNLVGPGEGGEIRVIETYRVKGVDSNDGGTKLHVQTSPVSGHHTFTYGDLKEGFSNKTLVLVVPNTPAYDAAKIYWNRPNPER